MSIKGIQLSPIVILILAACRRAAKAAAAAASQQAAGGSYLHEHPEWVLPFTLQVLAHHPEFPQQEDLEAGAAEALEPFMKMLQFTLEPLLLPMPGSADTPGSWSMPLSDGR